MADSSDHKSPFRLPTDEEVFLTREAEQHEKLEQRERLKNLKIWEKHTATTNRQLKRPAASEFNIGSTDEAGQGTRFHKAENNIVTEALDYIKQRKKAQNQTQPENIRDYVEDKKEIFRVEMKYRILKEEKEKIHKRMHDKELALRKHQEQFETDKREFTEEMEKGKKKKDEAFTEATKEAEARKEKESDIKVLEQQSANISSEISRSEETLENLRNFRKFLDRLSPPEWTEEQGRHFEARLHEKFTEWLDQQTFDNSADSQKNDDESHLSASQLSNKPSLKEKFRSLVEQGLVDVEEPKLYFEHPDQLTAVLHDLEEKSLFLIQQIQEKDNELEVNRTEFAQMQRKNKVISEEVRRKKESLEAVLRVMDAKLHALYKKKKEQENIKETTKSANTLQQDISECYRALFPDEDAGGMQPKEMLERTEGMLNDFLADFSRLREEDPKNMANYEKLRESDRQERNRELKLAAEHRQQQESIIQAQKRAQNTVVK